MAGYSKGLNDGGGLIGIVSLQSVHGEVRQRVSRSWAVNLGASYAKNRALIAPADGSPAFLNLTSANILVERNIGTSWGVRLGYAHDFQQEPTATTTLQGDVHRNRVFVTVSYQWEKALGR